MRRTFLLLALAAAPLVAATLTDEDRRFAIQQLGASRKLFLESVKGLSQEQWKFKPAPDRWSIAECAEHIALSEDWLFQFVIQKLLKSEPIPRLGAINRQDDEEVLKSARDRSKKAAAPEFLRPSGKWASQDDVIGEFRKRRERNVDYIRTTQDDLRAHVFQSGPGRIRDAYQYLLLMSAHTERHTAQIEEVKKDPRFPRASHKRFRLPR